MTSLDKALSLSRSSKLPPMDATKSLPEHETSSGPEPIDYRRIINLFSSHHSNKMFDRHQKVLEKFIHIFDEHAPPKEDIGHLTVVIQLAAERIADGGDILEDVFVHFLHTLVKLPNGLFQEPAEYQLEFFNGLASILVSNATPSVKRAVLDLITTFVISSVEAQDEAETDDEQDMLRDHLATRHKLPPTTSRPTLKTTPSELYHRAHPFLRLIEKSDIIRCLTEPLLQHPADVQVLAKALRILKHCCLSVQVIGAITHSLVIQQLCEVLATSLPDLAVAYALEIMSSIAESTYRPDLYRQMTSIESLQHIKTCMQHLMKGGHRLLGRQNRNDLLFLLLGVSTNLTEEELGEFAKSQMLHVLCEMLMHPETGTSIDFVLANGNDDFEAKCVLYDLVLSLCKNKKNMEYMIQADMQRIMLEYLTFQPKSDYIKSWNKTQLKKLQLKIIGAMHQVLPYMVREKIPVQFQETLIPFLEATLVHDTGRLKIGSNLDSAVVGLVPATLSLLLVLSELNESQRIALVERGLMPVLLSILTDPVHQSEVYANTLLLLASLCQHSKRNRAVFSKLNGVGIIVRFLKFNSPDPKEKCNVILSVLECIWETTVGHHMNEDVFFMEDGIYFMLDVLEQTDDVSQKRHILGTLLDLMENPRARAHVLEWRMNSDLNKGFGNLLIKLWNEEEKELGVEKLSHGFLKSLEQPLKGIKQLRVHPALTAKRSRAISELFENLRAKIYGALCKVGVESVEKSLSPEELVTLRLICKYLDFKIGEIWVEIQDELNFEGVRPVSPDSQCIQVAHEMTLHKASDTLEKQKEIVRKHDEHLKQDELKFYRHFLDSKLNNPANDRVDYHKKKNRVHIAHQK